MTASNRNVPRVYDDFDDGDTRLDPAALIGACSADVRRRGGTVLMPAALPPHTQPATAAMAPRPTPPAPERALEASGWRPNVVEVCVGIVATLVVLAVLAIGLVALL